MNAMRYAVIVEQADDSSFSVFVPDLPGCVSSGDTREEALDMIRVAIREHLETLKSLGEPISAHRSTVETVTA
jgi:predicted RNase H-like HicB family nuclease